MTIERSTALPPRWAEALLRMLLPPEERDSISGDLLEEYRESIVPALGGKADGWYVRQVAGYVMRKAWTWGALVGAILITRGLFDMLAPVHYTPGVVHPRSAIMSYALIGTFALASGWQVWQSGHLRSGVLVAFATAAFGGALSAAGTLVCLAIWHDPETLEAVRNSGGLAEALWGVPLLIVPIGLITGIAGAMAGRLANAIVYGTSKRNERST
jgi:hypothetical protein